MATTMSGDDQAGVLAEISTRDPGFDVEAFLSEAASTYLEVQRARATGTPNAVADKVNPAVRAQLGLDQAQPAKAQQAKSQAPTLGELRVTHASTDQAYDSIVVRIPVIDNGRTHVEDWCFQRPATATSKTAGAPIYCTNCGAPRQATPAGTCKFCGAPLTGGDGWVVTRVAAVNEPTPGRGQNAMELAAAISTIMEAATAAQQSRDTAGPFQQAGQPKRGSSAKGCGCLLLMALIFVVPAVAIGLAVAQPASTFHRRLSTMLPFVRRAYLTGQVTAKGASNSSGQSGNFVSTTVRCNKLYLKAQALQFSADLSDGLRITVKVDSRVGIFGTQQYTTAQDVSVTPSLVTSAGVTQQWSPNGSSTTSFVLTPSGGGQLAFTGYSAALTAAGAPTAPLTGTISWRCNDK